ncbi:hypothetical protein D7V86_25620 [bacterium D16-51]|nr:hypothetical protein D7V96_26115 [bacterium D16-59]RKI52860.1 hypothetical protein D7V86_25620 [bacterium D16-51]
MGKKNYKNMNFNNKEDYLYALYGLIEYIYPLLEKYIRYNGQLGHYLEEIMEKNQKYIDFNICEEWKDKIQNVSHGLLKGFVDEASTGFSYIMFRKLMNKTKYKLSDIPKDIDDELKELRDVRNWTFHLAQSDFVASREVFEKSVAPEFKKHVIHQFNPVKIRKYRVSETIMLASFHDHTAHRIEVYEKIFEIMKKDFEILLGEKIEIVECLSDIFFFLGDDFATAQLSMAMQKKKYDGSDEQYEKITGRKKNRW